MQITDPFNAGNLVSLVLGLLLVLVIFFVIAYVFKRMSGTGINSKGHMAILDALHLSARDKVVLVRVAEKVMVLGVSPSGISALHVMDNDLQIPENESVVDFKNKFSEILQAAGLKAG
jgi:flagellar protein FliO/FliZ